MTWQQIIVLVTTFLIGVCAGGYAYIVGYAPEYSLISLRDELVRSGSLSIRGEQIGGCQMMGVCPSFELTDDRRYSYVREHALNEETPDPTTGRLSPDIFNQLAEVVKEADLPQLQTVGDECQAAFDGIDYSYDVIIDGVSTELNSCGTQFYDSNLYYELLSLWSIMLTEDVEMSQ